MDQQTLLKIISKNLSGETSDEEVTQLNKWLRASSKNRDLYDAIHSAWRISKTKLVVENSDMIFEKIMERARKSEREKQGAITSFGRQRSGRYRLVKYAASIALFGLLSVFAILAIQFSNSSEMTEAGIRLIEKRTQKGQKLKITLADQSVVWLNSESVLVYPERFADTARSLKLVGEAFFEVQKDPEKPMIITAGDITTTVLGTSFNIYAYPENNCLAVSLFSGEVRVGDLGSQSPVVLKEGLAYNYFKNTRKSQIFPLQEGVMAWKEGVLFLKDETFESFIKKIERWFGVEVIVTGTPGKDWLLNGEFDNVSLDELMKYISYGREFRYSISIEEKMLTITFI